MIEESHMLLFMYELRYHGMLLFEAKITEEMRTVQQSV
jgi:hypothetical protein